MKILRPGPAGNPACVLRLGGEKRQERCLFFFFLCRAGVFKMFLMPADTRATKASRSAVQLKPGDVSEPMVTVGVCHKI